VAERSSFSTYLILTLSQRVSDPEEVLERPTIPATFGGRALEDFTGPRNPNICVVTDKISGARMPGTRHRTCVVDELEPRERTENENQVNKSIRGRVHCCRAARRDDRFRSVSATKMDSRPVPALHNVVNRPFVLDAQRRWHGGNIPRALGVNSEDRPLSARKILPCDAGLIGGAAGEVR
jgi:hypothetical protein